MVASGNDFIIIDNRKQKIKERKKLAKRLCQRKFGIGADGLLLLEPSKLGDFKMRIFNPDGSEPAMCGNGLRCMGLFLKILVPLEKKVLTGLEEKGFFSLETLYGVHRIEIKEKGVKVEIGVPKDLRLNLRLKILEKEILLHFVNLGVPHTLLEVENLSEFPVNKAGKAIRFHKEFSPSGTNVNFVKILNRHSVSIRTYERGVEEETLSCGTGVSASGFILNQLKKIDLPVKFLTASKEELTVEEEKDSFFLTGDASLVYQGSIL